MTHPGARDLAPLALLALVTLVAIVPRLGRRRSPVPVAAPAPDDAHGPPAAGLLFGRPLDLATADAEALTSLPGVGPGKARAILELRDERGGLHSVEELLDVPGIGPATLARLRPWVRVGRFRAPSSRPAPAPPERAPAPPERAPAPPPRAPAPPPRVATPEP